MATDATGTPTPLGIPTYNTAGDPPTGKGLNAIMQVIDALIAARAPIASPVFTGNPTAPTPATNDSDTSIATTAFVQAVAASILPSGITTPYAGATAPGGWLIADGSAVSRSTFAALFGVIGVTYGAGDGSTTFNLPDLRGRVPVGKNAATFAALGATGGEENHALSTAEMPAHAHAGSTLSSDSAGTPAGTVVPNSAGTPTGTNGPETVAHSHTYLQASAVANVTSGTGTGGQGVSLSTVSTSTESTGHGHAFTGDAMSVHGHTFTGSALSAHTHTLTIASAGGGGGHNNLQPYQVLNYLIKV